MSVGVTIAEAAELFGAKPKTVESWVYRAGLTSVGTRGQAYLYDYHELAEAELAARTHRLQSVRHSRSISV